MSISDAHCMVRLRFLALLLALLPVIFSCSKSEIDSSSADALYQSGNYKDALVAYEELLEKVPTESANAAKLQVSAGKCAFYVGQYDKALASFEQARKARSVTLGKDHPLVANTIDNTGVILDQIGRYEEAGKKFREALEIRERTSASMHDISTSYGNLGKHYFSQARYRIAEAYFQRSIDLQRRALHITDPDLGGETLKELPFVERMRDIAIDLNNLGEVLRHQGRYDESLKIHTEALSQRKNSLPEMHGDITISMNNLALVLGDLGRFEEAVEYSQEVLARDKEEFGEEHHYVAGSHTSLGETLRQLGRFSEAIRHQQDAVKIARKLEHAPSLAMSLHNLSAVLTDTGEHVLAIKLARESNELRSILYAPAHVERIRGDIRLSQALLAGEEQDEAFSVARKAANSARVAQRVDLGDEQDYRGSALWREAYVNFLSVGSMYKWKNAKLKASFLEEAFAFTQFATVTRVSSAQRASWARDLATTDQARRHADSRQALLEKRRRLSRQFAELISDKSEGVASVIAELEKIGDELDAIEELLEETFPSYLELVKFEAKTRGEVQTTLAQGDLMFATLFDSSGGFLWRVSQEETHLYRLDIDQHQLEQRVLYLREGLEPGGATGIAGLPTYDVSKAEELFEILLGEQRDQIERSTRLIFVADGALAAIPLAALVEREGPEGVGYSGTKWLGERVLVQRASMAGSPVVERSENNSSIGFLGVGAPTLLGENSANIAKSKNFESVGRVAMSEAVHALSPVPELESLLNSLSRSFDKVGSASKVLAGPNATEHALREIADLRPKTLIFATHGLVASETRQLGGPDEPALVLTPPTRGGEKNDGLLTASEVTHLNIRPELVVLAGCKTTAAESSAGGQPLSGLASAFFRLGADAVLASHWSIFSGPSSLFLLNALPDEDDSIALSKRLRDTRLSFIRGSNSKYNHPTFWAGFELVGDHGG